MNYPLSLTRCGDHNKHGKHGKHGNQKIIGKIASKRHGPGKHAARMRPPFSAKVSPGPRMPGAYAPKMTLMV